MRQALEMALEAFEEIAWSNSTDWQRDRAKVAITAIKEALAQPEQEPVAWADHGVINWIVDKQFKHASYLYEGSPPAPPKACIYCGQLVIKEKNT